MNKSRKVCTQVESVYYETILQSVKVYLSDTIILRISRMTTVLRLIFLCSPVRTIQQVLHDSVKNVSGKLNLTELQLVLWGDKC